MKLLIGPIIGLVTDTTARVLLEYDSDVSVTVTVVSTSSGKGSSVTKTLKERRPTIFKFGNLEPFTKYTVKVNPF